MTQPTDFAEAKLSAPDARVWTVVQEVLRLVTPGSPLRVLDACCGDGRHVLSLAEVLPKATLHGVDISTPNITQAQASLALHPEAARIRFEQADYLLRPADRYDLILSVSGVNFIPGAPEALFRRLDSELAPGGVLLLVTPAACAYNKTLLALRALFRALRSPALDALGLALARRLHGRHYSDEQLRERLIYLYANSSLLDAPKLRRLAAGALGWTLELDKPVPPASPAQLRHRLLAWRKTGTTPGKP